MSQPGSVSRSLRLSPAGQISAKRSFQICGVSQSNFVIQLGITSQRSITRQALGRFLKGERVERELFCLFCKSLSLEVSSVADDLDQIEPESDQKAIGEPSPSIDKPPNLNALQALYTSMESAEVISITVRSIHSSEELQNLWQIDNLAYGKDSIPLSVFYHWWERYQYGLKALFRGDEILGAFGIWPLSEDQSDALQEGILKEVDLLPSNDQTTPCNSWYISGIVLKDDCRSPRRNPIHLLLSNGLTMWLETSSIAYPLKILSLATSAEGERLLQRFSFIKIRETSQTAAGYPLYIYRATSKDDLISLLRKRYLY